MAVNYVKFVRGTPAAFKKARKDNDTLYFISEPNSTTGTLYLGAKVIAGTISNLNELENIIISESLTNGSLLVYDSMQQAWVNKTVREAIREMIGATATLPGASGLVPAPGAGQQNLFLRGDGTWAAPTGGSGENGSPTQTFEVIATDFSYESQIALLNEKVGDTPLNVGDIGIVKVLIGTNKYQYTAYVYNGLNWSAMDGNYSTDSIYFEEDMAITAPIGTITQAMIDNGNGVLMLDSKNKNMTDVLASILSEEKDPIIKLPKLLLSVPSESGEVGTSFSLPTAVATVSSVGNYSFGGIDTNKIEYAPDNTGVTFKVYDIVLECGNEQKKNTTVYSTDDTLALSVSKGNNIFKDTATNFKFVLKANYTGSSKIFPMTNLKNRRDGLIIKSGSIQTIEKNAVFTGYRKFFYDSNIIPLDLNSDNIRKLKGSLKSQATSFEMEIQDGARQVIIAIPHNYQLISVSDKKAFGVNIKPVFTLTSGVPVEGANGYNPIDYNVYVYNPVTELESNVYTVSVAKS